jgi:hypothetical protein
VLQVRLLGGAPVIDARFPPAPVKWSRWISALVVLIAAVAVAIGLVLAAFGLFAALRIAYGYGNSVERTSAAAPFGPSGWQRTPSGGTERIPSAPLAPPVLASSDPVEPELSLETASTRSIAPDANAEPSGIAEDRKPSSTPEALRSASTDVPEVPAAVSGEPVPGAAFGSQPTGSSDRVAAVPPANESAAVAPPQAKRHPAAKHHAARKRVRRVVRRPTHSGAAASPFQPMFNSQTFSSP